MNAGNLFEVYFDFDNTISCFDVLDNIIHLYSISDRWKETEEMWEAGLIGSKECLERQLSDVRLTQVQLDEYVRQVPIDPAFLEILEFLRCREIETKVVSDSFTPLIRAILQQHGSPEVPILANGLRIEGDRWITTFPYHNSICSTCANCKTSHLFKRGRSQGVNKIYIGDGRSDICPAQFCEIIFAKGSLFKHYAPLREDCIEFHELRSVYLELQLLVK